MKIDISKLKDDQIIQLVGNRWESSSTVWDIISKTYDANTAIYENRAQWLESLPVRTKGKLTQSNRIFVNMEAVINSLIANPPGINLIQGKNGEESLDLANKIERFLREKINDRNVKETMRMAYRNLYFSRFGVIKAFWNVAIDDFDFKAVDPRKLRVSKKARNEEQTEFVIEEIDDNLMSLIAKFPNKKDELYKKFGIQDENELYIRNPEVKYKETWICDDVVFTYDTIVLGTIKNPYYDFDGVQVSDEDFEKLNGEDTVDYRQILENATPNTQKTDESGQPVENLDQELEGGQTLRSYYYNYFDRPRKPYIFGTIFNNEQSPIGRTDMITLSASLQRAIDTRKTDIAENAELVNGVIKVDSGVMGKSDAQRIRWETRGIIWGKGVVGGVSRETGAPLPAMVFDDMQDSRQEIDNIMAASSAFKGERQGQETKAGRLALIQQSYLRLNELVQLTDYFYKEIYAWAYQLAKLRYTEYRYVKYMGKDSAMKSIELIRHDFENGQQFKVIPGKTLPVDDEFKFEQAQNDVKSGYISPVDYLEIAQYDNPRELSKNAVMYQMNPVKAVGVTPEEMQEMGTGDNKGEQKPPNVSINYQDLSPDAQVQLLAQIGIQADPEVIEAEKIASLRKTKREFDIKREMKNPVQTEVQM